MSAASHALAAAAIVVPHTDADGLSSGAIALRARGEDAKAALLIGRGRTPFDADAPLPPGPPAILDWGVRDLERPALMIDHHAPDPVGEGHVVVSGYGEEPQVSTSVLMRRVVPEAPAWLAALGAFGDLGTEGLALPECEGAPRTAVRKLAPLVNAPRRLPDGPVREALAILCESESPRAALADPRAALLEEARREWPSGLDAAMRTAPELLGEVALIRFASPYQVHPLVATAWQRRLHPRIVLAANAGYLPGRVNFSVRGGDGDLRTWLADALPGDGGSEFARGHDRATGGSLSAERFADLVTALRAAAA